MAAAAGQRVAARRADQQIRAGAAVQLIGVRAAIQGVVAVLAKHGPDQAAAPAVIEIVAPIQPDGAVDRAPVVDIVDTVAHDDGPGDLTAVVDIVHGRRDCSGCGVGDRRRRLDHARVEDVSAHGCCEAQALGGGACGGPDCARVDEDIQVALQGQGRRGIGAGAGARPCHGDRTAVPDIVRDGDVHADGGGAPGGDRACIDQLVEGAAAQGDPGGRKPAFGVDQAEVEHTRRPASPVADADRAVHAGGDAFNNAAHQVDDGGSPQRRAVRIRIGGYRRHACVIERRVRLYAANRNHAAVEQRLFGLADGIHQDPDRGVEGQGLAGPDDHQFGRVEHGARRTSRRLRRQGLGVPAERRRRRRGERGVSQCDAVACGQGQHDVGPDLQQAGIAGVTVDLQPISAGGVEIEDDVSAVARRENEAVGAEAAGQDVCAAVADQYVRPLAADQDVGPPGALQQVVARGSDQVVAVDGADQAFDIEQPVACVAVGDADRQVGDHRRRGEFIAGDVETRAAVDQIGPAAAVDEVVAAARRDQVVAVAAGQDVGVRAADQAVVALVAIDEAEHFA